MPEMTEQEIEEAVAHDMKILEESWAEHGFQDPDDREDRQVAALDSRIELLEARLDAKVQATRADLMRWILVLFCAATLVAALLIKL